MNQEQLILKHFRKYKYISSMKAIELYGITRLASRIHDLRNEGYKIGSIWRESVNRYGNTVRYLDYFLLSAPKFRKGN